MEENLNINNYIEFINKIFKRNNEPIEQLQRIFDNHPTMFFIKEVCDYINTKLREFGYQLNMDYLNKESNIYYSCGRSNSRGCSKPSRGCSSRRTGGCSGSRRDRDDDDYERCMPLFIAYGSAM